MKSKKNKLTFESIEKKQELLREKQLERNKVLTSAQDMHDEIRSLSREIETDLFEFKLQNLSVGSCLYNIESGRIMKLVDPKTDSHFKNNQVTFTDGNGHPVETVSVRAYRIGRLGGIIGIQREQFTAHKVDKSIASSELIDASVFDAVEAEYIARETSIGDIVKRFQEVVGVALNIKQRI